MRMTSGKVNNLTGKLADTNKFVLGFVALAISAIVGSVGLAGALPGSANATPPPNKDDCKNGGYVNYGYKNQGLCVSAWVQANNGGYGGVDVDANVGVDLR